MVHNKKYRLGDYISRSTKNNHDLTYGADLIVGVTSEGRFSVPKGNVEGVNLKPYKIVNNGDFVYNPSRLDLGSIAYRTEGLCIVSHLYIIFHLNERGKRKILPEYLFMYLRRKEFYREVTFRNFGSQRPEFSYNDMKEIRLPLPPLSAQQKAVSVYNELKENLATYESGLSDLKLTCDGFMDELRRKYEGTKLGAYLQYSDRRNDEDLDLSHVRGLSIDKKLIPTKANMQDVGLGKYKILEPKQFAYVPVTSRNGGKITLALNDTKEKYLVSSAYEVFGVDKEKICPEYLMMFFSRPEFDRYSRFHSWGSARETFDWSEMCNVKIPLPNIKIQQSIADIYSCYIERKRIADELREEIKNICPLLLRGALMTRENNSQGGE